MRAMHHEVSLRASNPVVLALVGAWLADARLVLPRPVTLVIDVAPLPEPIADSRAVFRQGRVSIRTGAITENTTLDWEPGLGRGVIEPGSTKARVTITELALERPNELLRSFLLNVCILLLRRIGLHHVHGAMLRDPLGRGWLLAGESGSGKSTTTALLARSGWDMGTDDITFLTAGQLPATTDVIAWRERLALRADVLDAFDQHGGTALTSRGKTGWFPEEVGAKWVSRVTPAVVAFTSVSGGDRSSVSPMRGKEALSRLMQCSPWVALEADVADEHLGLMTRLVQQARLLQLNLGRDLFERPDLLLELVA
ncbi:MAG: hypothetical protein ABJE47_00545 [bacterium]